MLTYNRNKLDSWTFNIPRSSCENFKSEWCDRHCYAARGRFNFSTVKDSNKRNLDLANSAQFVDTINTQIKKKNIPTVRIHSVGEFFSPEYAEKWYNIIEHNPQCTFWAFSRAFKDRKIKKVLLEMDNLPNAVIWASADLTMPIYQFLKDTKIKRYSLVTDLTAKQIIEMSDVRGLFDTFRKHLCTHQINGTVCTQCRRCLDKDSKFVVFGRH